MDSRAARTLTFRRIAALAVGAAATSVVASLAALQVLLLTLPPSVAAHGLWLWELLADPAVLIVLGYFVIPATVVGFLASLFFLRRADLSTAIPFVGASTVGTAALFGWMNLFAVVPTLAVAGLTMVVVWRTSRRAPDRAAAVG